jgi:ADP-ribose pyrophosphatase YjhB (NUDIX family)
MVSKRTIRTRVCLAAIRRARILLVPHYDTDVGPVQWCIPGGELRYGESLQACALREFKEETGLRAKVVRLADVSEVILPREHWHSVTITFVGKVTGGRVRAERSKKYGKKAPCWFSKQELRGLKYHPKQTIDKLLLLDSARSHPMGR